jgi:hypothetical protein
MNILHYQAYDQLIVWRVEKLHYDNHVYVMLHNEQMQSKENSNRNFFMNKFLSLYL